MVKINEKKNENFGSPSCDLVLIIHLQEPFKRTDLCTNVTTLLPCCGGPGTSGANGPRGQGPG